MKTVIKVRFTFIFDQKSSQKFAFANFGIFEKNLILLSIKNSDMKFSQISDLKEI